jgi:ribose transport system substrate-binding protein
VPTLFCLLAGNYPNQSGIIMVRTAALGRSARWLLASSSLFAFLSLMVAGCDSKRPTDSATVTSSGTTGDAASKTTTSKRRIVFLINTDDPFWDACRQGLKEGEKAFKLNEKGLSAEMEVPDGTLKGQIDKLRQLASQKDVAGVALSAISADNPSIAAELESLNKRGVKVITVDGDVLRSKYRDRRKYYIGTDNDIAGEFLGKAAAALLAAKGKTEGGYVQFAGYTDNDNARSRMDGFKKGVGEAFKELDRMSDETDRTRAQENVRNAMSNHKQSLVGLVGIWAYNAPAIATVVESAGVKKDVTVVTFDAQEQAIKEMEKGNIDAMMVQNPFDMGYQTSRLLSAMVLGDESVEKEMFPKAGSEGGDIYTTGLRLVVPNEGSPLKAEDYDPKVVEFMKLDDFKKWLAKYGLKSS